MTQEDWEQVMFVLRWRYGDDFLTDPGENGDWFNECLLYPFDSVNRAVRYYCEACDERPTLNNFLIALEEIHRGRVDDFFNMKSSVFKICHKCNDYGFYYLEYPTKLQTVRACDCSCAEEHEALSGEEKMTDEDCLARFGVGLRFLDKSKVRYIRKPRIQLDKNRTAGLEYAKRINAPHANAKTMSERPVIYEVRYGT